jgi:hypothetical protein
MVILRETRGSVVQNCKYKLLLFFKTLDFLNFTSKINQEYRLGPATFKFASYRRATEPGSPTKA